jgi:SpoVK/Ycf46/Vps4 family AAA+-type ATPase
MKTEVLIQMEGLSRANDLVFVLAATNLPWDLDFAMLRRLEKCVPEWPQSHNGLLAMPRCACAFRTLDAAPLSWLAA